MNVDLVKQHALELAAAYAYLLHKTEKRVHDPNDHNLCSAVVVPESGRTKTLLSYSNPSALSAALKSEMGLCSGEVIDKFINRGGMQDYHTEVRLITTI
jgi:hypothetical protein